MTQIIPVERIEQMILLIRGEKVMLDSDLAKLYPNLISDAVRRESAVLPVATIGYAPRSLSWKPGRLHALSEAELRAELRREVRALGTR